MSCDPWLVVCVLKCSVCSLQRIPRIIKKWDAFCNIYLGVRSDVTVAGLKFHHGHCCAAACPFEVCLSVHFNLDKLHGILNRVNPDAFSKITKWPQNWVPRKN